MPSEPPSTLGRRLKVSAAVGVAAWITSAGCFFELGERPTGGIGGASPDASGGAGGVEVSVGGADVGGADNTGGSAEPACEFGQKPCDGTCVPATPETGCGNPTCDPCPAPPNTDAACSTEGSCVLTCLPDFADCNGDVVGALSGAASNGCEYFFGTTTPAPDVLEVPFAQIRTDDGDREDWGTVPVYPLAVPCDDCQENAIPPVLIDGQVPARVDLDARFRVAWDNAFLYVLLDVYDEHLFSEGNPNPNCHGGACEDGLAVYLDGRNDRVGGYGSDNSRTFIGVSGRIAAPAQEQPSSAKVGAAVTPVGGACYRIEARFDWAHVTAANGGGDVAGHFPPLIGQSYGFDVAVNDWDPGLSEGSIERQSQLFWIFPGKTHSFDPSHIGTMILSGGPGAPTDAGPQ